MQVKKVMDATTIALYQNIAESEAMDQETTDKNEINETKYFYKKLINTISTLMNIENWKNHMYVNLNLEERQNNFFLKIKMFDKKLAEFNYKVLSRILACGELVSRWDNFVRSKCFQCNEIDFISHLLYESKLANLIWHRVNHSLSVNIQLEDIVFDTKLTSDLNYAVSLVYFCLYKHWILNHMNNIG